MGQQGSSLYDQSANALGLVMERKYESITVQDFLFSLHHKPQHIIIPPESTSSSCALVFPIRSLKTVDEICEYEHQLKENGIVTDVHVHNVHPH